MPDTDTGTPEIIDTETERSILHERVVTEVARILPRALNPDLTVGKNAEVITAMALTGVLRNLRVLSARQLAVLLAQEADRHAGFVIHEPPRYAAAEIEGAR